MHPQEYAERNREAWNQVMPIHRQQSKTDLREAVKSDDFSTLDAIETAMFEKLSVRQKTVAQLCCNNGRELISVVNLGATRGVGFDISDEAIKEATLLASLSNTHCEFVRTNVYDMDPAYFNQFDLVYITIGTLCWFDDLQRLFQVVAQLLRENGHLFLYEMHPFLDLFALPAEEPYDPQNELKIAYSYFKADPFVDTNGLDYIGNTTYEAKTTYSFPHTISATFTAILNNKLAVREFQEYPHDISLDFRYLEKYQMLPMCYTLLAQKCA